MIHVAGDYEDGVQRCDRCGVILTDHRGAMVPVGSGPLGAWEPGAHVEVITGNPKYSGLTDEQPNCRRTH